MSVITSCLEQTGSINSTVEEVSIQLCGKTGINKFKLDRVVNPTKVEKFKQIIRLKSSGIKSFDILNAIIEDDVFKPSFTEITTHHVMAHKRVRLVTGSGNNLRQLFIL